MPRHMPVAQKARVSKVVNTPEEDDLQAFLCASDDIE